MEPGFITAEKRIEHQNITMCAVIDKTQLFLVNQLALTRVELKF